MKNAIHELDANRHTKREEKERGGVWALTSTVRCPYWNSFCWTLWYNFDRPDLFFLPAS